MLGLGRCFINIQKPTTLPRHCQKNVNRTVPISPLTQRGPDQSLYGPSLQLCLYPNAHTSSWPAYIHNIKHWKTEVKNKKHPQITPAREPSAKSNLALHSAWPHFNLFFFFSLFKYPGKGEGDRERKERDNVRNALFDNVSFGNWLFLSPAFLIFPHNGQAAKGFGILRLDL